MNLNSNVIVKVGVMLLVLFLKSNIFFVNIKKYVCDYIVVFNVKIDRYISEKIVIIGYVKGVLYCIYVIEFGIMY